MINVALIGCGYWGPNLARNFFENSKYRMAWCCDLQPARLKVLQNRHPTVKITTNYQDIVKDSSVEAVAIATPLFTHYPLAKQFLDAGKHVFVEKPLTHSYRSADELFRRARRARKVLMTGYTYLYSPYVQKIKSIIDSGTMGDLRYIQSKRVHFGHLKPNEGVLWDLVPHDLAVMLHWTKITRCDVSCSGNDHFGRGHHDTVSLNITSPEGPGAYVFASLLAPLKMRNMIVAGTKKMIFYNDARAEEKIKVFNQFAVTMSNAFKDVPFNYKMGHVHSPHVSSREPLQIEIDDFASCIERGGLPRSGEHFSLRVLRLLEAADHSLRTGRTIKGVRL